MLLNSNQNLFHYNFGKFSNPHEVFKNKRLFCFKIPIEFVTDRERRNRLRIISYREIVL